jgi:hypothetical protein
MIVRPTGNPVTDALKNMNSDLREARSKLAASELLLDEEKESKPEKRGRRGVLFLFLNSLVLFYKYDWTGRKKVSSNTSIEDITTQIASMKIVSVAFKFQVVIIFNVTV